MVSSRLCSTTGARTQPPPGWSPGSCCPAITGGFSRSRAAFGTPSATSARSTFRSSTSRRFPTTTPTRISTGYRSIRTSFRSRSDRVGRAGSALHSGPMPEPPVSDFPLFPLGIVALPEEVIPLHIFEDRYKTMMDECLASDKEFGIVWLSDDGLKEIGCACRIEQVLERMEDGRLNLLCRGIRPIRIVERQSHLAYPAGVIEYVDDRVEAIDP